MKSDDFEAICKRLHKLGTFNNFMWGYDDKRQLLKDAKDLAAEVEMLKDELLVARQLQR